MASYGIIIDEFASVNENIYQMFVDYFKNPVMTKMKDESNFSMYACKAYCLLSKECRYIIVFVNKDNFSIRTEKKLSELFWVSLQTRTLYDQFDIKTHGYQPVAEGPLLAKIERIDISKEASTYKCEDFPIVVTLLHTLKKNSDTYQNRGTVIAALETWETIITFNEN
jgi:hypothetical protein